MNDELLTEQTRQETEAAFATLVANRCPAVYRIARNLCTSSRDAEEVTRETFLFACRARSRPRDPRSLAIWLYRIALENALGRRQDTRRPPSVSPEVFLPRFDADGNLEPPGREWPDAASLERMNVAGLLREMLSCMDDHVRAAFVLCDLLDLPTEDAAAILQTLPQVVRRDVHRARLMFRGFFDQMWK